MKKNKLEKILEYIIWLGLAVICLSPLLVSGSYYFPFITFKTLIFKIAVAVVFLAYLALAYINKKYRIKLTLPIILFSLYIVTVFISSLLGGNFYLSFWGNNERSEGLLLLLHLLLFLIVLVGFFQPTEEDLKTKLHHTGKWLMIFDVFFLVSVLVSFLALGQHLHWSWIIKSAGGIRLASTIGNAGYVAGYLIFSIFFASLLIFFRKNKWLRLYYTLGVLLHIFVVFNTLTRGGIISLVLSLVLFVLYFAFARFKRNKAIVSSAIIIALLAVGFIGLIFLNKKADWVQKNNVFETISRISAEEVTAQNRLMTWESAYKGFKEKSILGYGYENFYIVFDKYFNPKIYRKAGSVVWFDRAHNIIFDRLITGGLVGLLLYLGFLFLPVVCAWKYFRKHFKGDYLVPVIFSLLILSYFIQNLFIFEALVTYIPLFLTIGFLSHFCPSWGDKFSQSFKPYLSLLVIGIVAFIPLMYIVNIKPAQANRSLIKAIVFSQDNKPQEAYDQFIKTIEMNTYANQEYRQHFGEFVAALASAQGIDPNFQGAAAIRAEEEFDKQIKEKPKSARNCLMFMRFLNTTYQFNIERVNKALALGKKAIELSPTRPMTYHEIAYSEIYLGRYYDNLGKHEQAKSHYDVAIDDLQKGIDLNDKVTDSYVNMIMALTFINKTERVEQLLKKMDDTGIDYHTAESLERMANTAVHATEYELLAIFYEDLTQINPENPDYLVNLALSYAYQGEKEKAIAVAQKVADFGETYVEQSKSFIEDVKAGKFKK